MVKTKSAKKGISKGAIVGIGAGVVAASVAAYLLLGPDGKKNRKAVSNWGSKMKAEVIKKLKSAKKITEPMYNTIIDTVQAKYAGIKSVDQKELKATVADMRKHWKVISKSMHSKPKPKAKTKASKKK